MTTRRDRTRPDSARRLARGALIALALLCAAGLASARTEGPFANGLTMRLHDAAEILAEPALLAGAAGGPYVLSGAADDWHAFDPAVVRDAVAGMRGFRTDVTVDVYILPVPPRGGGRSWSVQDAVFLVPGFGPVAPETQAYITTHELGHVLTWSCLDAHPARWQAYLDARGLSLDKLQQDVPHAWRPREILAEDLRYLFGGPLANVSRSIENHDLPTPDRVDGLRDLLSGFLSDRGAAPRAATSCAYPNPCNPRTTIRMSLPEGVRADGAELRVYDLRGALVRRVTGGRAAPGVAEIAWDGKDDGGATVASGRYLYVMRSAGRTARGAVTLVR